MEQQLWSILQHKLSKDEIQQKLAKLRQFTENDAKGCFSVNWLEGVFKAIDHIWYDDLLSKLIYNAYPRGLLFKIEKMDDERVAGYVMEIGERDQLILHMNRDLFVKLFEDPLRIQRGGYHSGGLLCQERIVCFLHVLLHETVHLILTVLDKLGFRTEIRDHGKDFNRIIRNLFGHTDSRHGLIPGFLQYHDLQEIRHHLRKGQTAEVYIERQWQHCKIQKVGYKWVTVKKIKKNGDTKQYRVHIGLVRVL